MISLAEKHPELEAEWDDSNAPLTPWNVSYGSNKKVRWKGMCGHTWVAIIKNRANGHGCPVCTGNTIEAGINDFASLSPEIAAEWSEKNHDKPSNFTNHSPHFAWWKCRKCGYEWQAKIADRVKRGCGCSNCLGRVFKPGVNDFATEHPDIAKEWSKRNGKLKPSMVWSKSRLKVWWKCKICGYEWEAVIDSRIKGHNPCPSCADLAVNPGFNDLETVCPELASEWDYERNKGLTPDKILASSMRPVFWKDYYGHSWWTKISSRMAGEGCPYCLRDNYYLFKLKSIAYYANKAGLRVWFRDQSEIGIPLELYIPKKKVAIEFYGTKFENGEIRQFENGKNWACLNAGIKLIRVIPPGQKEFDNCICITLMEDTIHSYKYALRHILRIIGIKAEVDIERDTEAINGTVLTEGVHDEESYDKDITTGTWNTTLAGNMLPHKQKTRRI
ncbi:MAG: zinc-ribbon domain-containing protein [Lachnospiraceae bacterium]|nr:zinc-ribbon domain-containing protein [Lachnospiraceae bacterium]